MKILFAAPFEHSERGVTCFINSYYLFLARSMRRQGHETRLISSSEHCFDPCVPEWMRDEFISLCKYLPGAGLFHENLIRKQFLDYLARYRPDVVFVHFLNSFSKHRLIRDMQERGVTVVSWYGINPLRTPAGIRKVLRQVDCIFFYDEAYRPVFRDLIRAKRADVVPFGVDTGYYDDVCSCLKKSGAGKRRPVSFLGIVDEHRHAYFSTLSPEYFSLWTWSSLRPFPELKSCHRGHAGGRAAAEIMAASLIVLNIHRAFEVNGGNYRLFEIPACRALQIVDERPGIERYFKPGHEIITVTSPRDLRDKVEYFLKHERERKEIAENGYNRVCREHGIDSRARLMLEAMRKIQASMPDRSGARDSEYAEYR